MVSGTMIVLALIIASLLQPIRTALQEDPPEPEDLLLVNGLQYDFSLAKSQRECVAPIGLERKIEFDNSFSASSYSRTDRQPSAARLNSATGWQPKTSDPDQSQWLALDLMKVYKITGVAIQAGNWQDDSSSGTFGNWVTRYRVQYSDSNGPNDFVDYTLDGAVQHFDGNHHQFNTVKQSLRIPIVSRYIRIIPEAWNREIGLRVELYGCDYPLDMISFTGKEVLRMNTNDQDRPSVYYDSFRGFVSLRFRTSRPSGLLVHGVGSTGDYFGIELNMGKIVVNINLGSSARIDGKTMVKVGNSLYDSQWHWLNVSRVGRGLTVSLDGYATFAMIKGSFENLNIDTRLTFGGTDRFTLPGIGVSMMFKGCVENLNVNGYQVISEVQRKQNAAFGMKGFLYSTCREDGAIPVTFEDYDSMLYIEGAQFSRRGGETYLADLSRNREKLQPFLVVEFAFRTWEETGLILYNGYSEGYLQIGLYQGLLQVLIYIRNDDTPYRPARIGYSNLNDGAWHQTRLEFSENFIVVIIDEEVFAVNRLFPEFTPSRDYHFGGYFEKGTGDEKLKPDMWGFIGCLKSLQVNGQKVSLQRLLLGDQSLPSGGRVRAIGKPKMDQCPIVDRCTPNPCFHGGICFQSWFDFICDCTLTLYDNDRLCYSSTFLPSCEAYEFLNETASGDRYIDVDGAGPIPPYLVDCDIGGTVTAQNNDIARLPMQYLHKLSFFYKTDDSTFSVVTIVKVNDAHRAIVNIPAVSEPGGYTYNIGYGATDINHLGYLADMSNTCMQYIHARCYNGAKLLNSPSNSPPYAWWVSRQGYRMVNWGNATAHSGKCGCAMTPGQQCVRSEYYCNCDAPPDLNQDDYQVDDRGYLMEKEYLPLRQVKGGGTNGRRNTDKALGFLIGHMFCAGDKRMQNQASFRDQRASMFFPAVDATYAVDVSFYFKTRRDKGVFMVFTGSDKGRRFNYPRLRDRDGNNFYLPRSNTDEFKISLVKSDQTADSIIELSYHNGFRRHVYRFFKPSERRVLNDGMWHYIHVTYTIKDVKVRIDNLFFAPTESNEELYVDMYDNDFNYDPLLIKSERDERLFLNDQILVGADTGQVNGFVGCMRALMINGNLLDLYGHAKYEPGFLTFPGCVGPCDFRNPCQNNGICFEYWWKFSCDCRESAFGGKICTEEIGTYYDGSDVTVWNIPSSLRQKSMATDTITFGFMTDKPQGTIFLLESENGQNSIHAFMSGDGLMVRFDYSGLYRELQDRNTYTDNKFHSVVIKRDTKITMQVDNYPTVVLDNVGSVPGMTNPTRFYVGNDAKGKNSGGFIGCVSRLRVNHLVPLRATEGLDRSGGGQTGNCGQLSPMIDPFWKPDFFPNWPNDTYMLPLGAIRDDRLHDINANVGIGLGIVGVIALLIIAVVAIKHFMRKGSYRTDEDAGAYNTHDASEALTLHTGRYPIVTTKEEIFL